MEKLLTMGQALDSLDYGLVAYSESQVIAMRFDKISSVLKHFDSNEMIRIGNGNGKDKRKGPKEQWRVTTREEFLKTDFFKNVYDRRHFNG